MVAIYSIGYTYFLCLLCKNIKSTKNVENNDGKIVELQI